jgi:Tfp pilus assembly protein FimV
LLLSAALAAALPCAQATETSAAAASALKVLGAPLNSASSPNTPGASGMTLGDYAHSNTHITVQKGESIDAVIRRGLPGMPLKDEFMRQALAKANPKIFPRGRTYPVRPGTVLALPSPEALRQHILTQAPQAAVLFQGSAVPQDDADTPTGPDKRRWVRFP